MLSTRKRMSLVNKFWLHLAVWLCAAVVCLPTCSSFKQPLLSAIATATSFTRQDATSVSDTNTSPLQGKKLLLRYFDARGAAEVSRVLLKISNVDFEDFRFPIRVKEGGGFETPEFNDAKKEGEFRINMDRVPILEIDGKMSIGQSRSIERYVANICNLMGDNEEEKALIDCITENVRDIKDRWGKIRSTGGFGPNEEKDKLIEKWFKGGEFAEWLQKLEKSLPENDAWYSVGNRLSYADVAVWHLLRDYFPQEYQADIKAAEKKVNCIRLLRIADKVSELASMKSYLTSRPQTMF